MTAASSDSSVNAASPSMSSPPASPALPSSSSPSSSHPERPIRFWLGDRQVSVDGAPPTLTLLEWMRERGGCASVKEGCAEGDCGACTVAVTDLNADGEPQVRAVNACIQFLGTLDGKAVQSAQDIAPADALHPVQQAMVDCHGSQCGFCTPGFVMSMFALYETRRAAADPEASRDVSRDDALRALSGNLCRCTGYRPIVDATRAMCAAPWQGPDMAVWKTRLAGIAADGDAVFASGIDVATHWPGHTPGRFYAPRHLSSLSAVLADRPQARIVAGSTDVGLWVTKQHRAVGDVVWLGAVRELQGMQDLAGDAAAAAVWGDGTPVLEIGAAVSLSDALDALLPHLPNCASYFDRFASVPIRNAGTLVGNLANGSPIGDCPPLMLALGASLVLHRGGMERVVSLDDFYLGYQKNCLLPGELVRSVRVPLPADVAVHAWKVSKRLEQDISAVAVATAFRIEDSKVTAVRIGVGGMAAVPSRAPKTEAALLGLDTAVPDRGAPDHEAVATAPNASAMTTRAEPGIAAASQTTASQTTPARTTSPSSLILPMSLSAALDVMRTEFAPLDDLRASAAYRREVASNLLLRSWLALTASACDAPSASSTNVSSANASNAAPVAQSVASASAPSSATAHTLADLSPVLMEITP